MAILSVPNWSQLQHYKTRSAPWLKMYTATLRHPKYRVLTLGERGLLADLWRLAVETDNAIPDDQAWLALKLGTTDTLAPMIAHLLAQGHIVDASMSASTPLPLVVGTVSTSDSQERGEFERGEGDRAAHEGNGRKPQPEAPRPRNVHPSVARVRHAAVKRREQEAE